MTAQEALKKIMELGLLDLDGDYIVGFGGNKTDDSDLYQALLFPQEADRG